MAETTTVTGAEVVAQARTWLGVPYLYGGTTRRGVDCSGLVMEVFAALGITVPRTSEEQWSFCEHIPAGQERTGDLCFIIGSEIDPPPGHVMIVVNPGNPDKVIDAPYTGTVVRYDTYSRTGTGDNTLVGYGRVKGIAASPTGNASTLSTTTQKQRAQTAVQGAENAAVAFGMGIGFFIVGMIIVVAGIILWKVMG